MIRPTLLALALLASPAVAAPAGKAAPARSCYDLAWESQEMKDCLARRDTQPGPMHQGMHRDRAAGHGPGMGMRGPGMQRQPKPPAK